MSSKLELGDSSKPTSGRAWHDHRHPSHLWKPRSLTTAPAWRQWSYGRFLAVNSDFVLLDGSARSFSLTEARIAVHSARFADFQRPQRLIAGKVAVNCVSAQASITRPISGGVRWSLAGSRSKRTLGDSFGRSRPNGGDVVRSLNDAKFLPTLAVLKRPYVADANEPY